MTVLEEITEDDYEPYDMLPTDPAAAEDTVGEGEPNG